MSSQLHRGPAKGIDEAVRVLHKRQGPATEAALQTYKRLVRSVLSRQLEQEVGEHVAIVGLLRESLFRLANQYKASTADRQCSQDIEELLMATHYQHMLYANRNFGLKDVAAKCAVTLLKYPAVIPQDKAFYQAGTVCKEQGNTNLAFMLLNRFVIDV